MARAKADLPSSDQMRGLIDAEGRIAVRVTPGARQQGVSIEGGQVQVKVRAKPQDGAANQAVVKLLAQALGIAPSRIELLRGATSRDKLFKIQL
ncbi:MAG: hypothetical protein APF78_03375 [Sphingomonadales bacterium BRH_c3]|nr:MAG: hypothetical protein APF78_03375 [Sphingomonadales bacterium BRH_c3]